jgi:hypothetical protein
MANRTFDMRFWAVRNSNSVRNLTNELITMLTVTSRECKAFTPRNDFVDELSHPDCSSVGRLIGSHYAQRACKKHTSVARKC